MADSIMNAATEVAAIVPEIWSAKFYPTLLENLPFNSSIAQDYQGDISALGDIVNISTIPQFDLADEILENEKANADSVTVSTQQLTINKQLVKDFILTKKAMAQSIDAMNELRDLAMHSIMKKMQAIIIAAIVPSTSPDHSLAYTSGTTLALADILAIKELLDNADVSEVGRTMILGAAAYNDLFNITGFNSRDFIPSGSPLSSGAITAPVCGFDVKWTSEVGTVSYFFQPMFMQMAVQQLPEVKVFDQGVEGKRSVRVNLDVLWGLKQCSDLRVGTLA